MILPFVLPRWAMPSPRFDAVDFTPPPELYDDFDLTLPPFFIIVDGTPPAGIGPLGAGPFIAAGVLAILGIGFAIGIA